MIHELIYTSAERGLKPGSYGFCTVAATRDLPKELSDRLELMSGYRHPFGPESGKSALNPVAWSHRTLTLGGTIYHVLSRVADCDADYTKRSNKLAHHIAFLTSETPQAGPAAVLSHPDLMLITWNGQPRYLTAKTGLPRVSSSPCICQRWRDLTGDAGWGGILAESASDSNSRVSIIYPPGTDMLALIAESLQLLPIHKQWRVTFSTYFTKLDPGTACQWRCVLDGTAEATAARREASELTIDLCRNLGVVSSSQLVETARNGIGPHISTEKYRTHEIHASPKSETTNPRRSVMRDRPKIQVCADNSHEHVNTPQVDFPTQVRKPLALPPRLPKRSVHLMTIGLSGTVAVLSFILVAVMFPWKGSDTLRRPSSPTALTPRLEPINIVEQAKEPEAKTDGFDKEPLLPNDSKPPVDLLPPKQAISESDAADERRTSYVNSAKDGINDSSIQNTVKIPAPGLLKDRGGTIEFVRLINISHNQNFNLISLNNDRVFSVNSTEQTTPAFRDVRFEFIDTGIPNYDVHRFRQIKELDGDCIVFVRTADDESYVYPLADPQELSASLTKNHLQKSSFSVPIEIIDAFPNKIVLSLSNEPRGERDSPSINLRSGFGSLEMHLSVRRGAGSLEFDYEIIHRMEPQGEYAALVGRLNEALDSLSRKSPDKTVGKMIAGNGPINLAALDTFIGNVEEISVREKWSTDERPLLRLNLDPKIAALDDCINDLNEFRGNILAELDSATFHTGITIEYETYSFLWATLDVEISVTRSYE